MDHTPGARMAKRLCGAMRRLIDRSLKHREADNFAD